MPNNLRKLKPVDFETSVSVLMEEYGDFFTTGLKCELINFVNLFFSRNNDYSNSGVGHLQYLKFIVDKNILNSFSESISHYF